jgi:hypothetical protein
MERNKVLIFALLIMGMSTTISASTPEAQGIEAIKIKVGELRELAQNKTTGWLNQVLDKALEKMREIKTGVPSVPAELPTSTPATPTPNIIPGTSSLGTAVKYLAYGAIAAIAGKKVYDYQYNQSMVNDITQNPTDIKYIQVVVTHKKQEYVRRFHPQQDGSFTIKNPEKNIAFANLGTHFGTSLQNGILKNVETGKHPVTIEIDVFLNNRPVARHLTTTTATFDHTKDTPDFGKALWEHHLAPRMRVLPYQKEENALVATDKELVKIEAFITHNQILTSPATLSALVPPALILGGVTNKYILGASLLVPAVWSGINKANPTFKMSLPWGLNTDGTHITAKTVDTFNEKIEEFNANTQNHPEREYTITITRHYKDTISNETMRYKFTPVKLKAGKQFEVTTREQLRESATQGLTAARQTTIEVLNAASQTATEGLAQYVGAPAIRHAQIAQRTAQEIVEMIRDGGVRCELEVPVVTDDDVPATAPVAVDPDADALIPTAIVTRDADVTARTEPETPAHASWFHLPERPSWLPKFEATPATVTRVTDAELRGSLGL